MSHDRKITSSKILAYTSDNKYVETIPNIDTVADLNGFIIKNSDYDIVNCEVEFDNGTILSSHDDAEISIQLLDNSTDQNFINDIFEKYNLDKRLIETLKNNLGHYIAIDKLNNIVRVYETFDDYVENRRD